MAVVYTNEAQGLDGLLEAQGNHVVHPSHKETENWPTAAQGAQLRAGQNAITPQQELSWGHRTRGQQAPPASFRSQLKMKKPSPVDSEWLE